MGTSPTSDNLAARRYQTRDNSITQPLRTEADVAANVDFLSKLSSDVRPDCPAELLDSRTKKFVVGDAADIVFAENCRFQHLLPEYTRRTD